MLTILVTCHTDECENGDVTIPLTLEAPVDAVVCGVCGVLVYDVVEAAPYEGGAPDA